MTEVERKQREAAHADCLVAWHTKVGTLRGVCGRYRGALDTKYYSKLKKPVVGYKGVTIRE